MLYKFFVAYPYVVYSILVWSYIFIFIRFKGIKKLWPIAIIGALVLFSVTYWLVSVGLYKFNIRFLPILGIPFFYVLWGAGNGIIFSFYYGETLFKKIVPIIGFPALIVLFEYFVEQVKKVEHLGKFTDIHEYFFDIAALSIVALIMTNIFGSRINNR